MIRVSVGDGSDWFVHNVVPVFLLNEPDDRRSPSYLFQCVEGGSTGGDGLSAGPPRWQWVEVPDDGRRHDELGPTWLIPRSEARELAEKLLEHLDHTAPPGDARALRADLEHERGRVDRMLDTLLALVAAPPAPDRVEAR